MRKHDLRPGEVLCIGGTRIKLCRKSGQFASLAIDAPPDVEIRVERPEASEEGTEEAQTE